MDLSSWSDWQLQQWCVDEGRDPRGWDRYELETWVCDQHRIGKGVQVWIPKWKDWDSGVVLGVPIRKMYTVRFVSGITRDVSSINEECIFDDDQPEPPEESESEESEEYIDLSSYSVKGLREELRERGLHTGGVREELEARLQCAIHAQEDEDEEGLEAITAGMANLQSGGPRKRALIIGCSYKGTGSELGGTINDARSIRDLLITDFDFDQGDIKLLTDEHNDRFLQPTQHNILKGMDWLMQELQPGDSLFFYFSGHGGQERDRTGEEPSGFNQTICPCDYKQAGIIKDSDIHERLVAPLPMGVTLHALLDSCHSGTVMNLPFNASMRKGSFHGWNEEYKGKSYKKTTAGGMACQFSASRHDQYAREYSTPDGQRNGAATYAFVEAVRRHASEWGFNIVYGELLEAMYAALQSDRRFRDQEPQFSASMQFDCMSQRTKFNL